MYQADSFWLSQKQLSELFDVDVRTVNEHLQNIYKSGELLESSTIRKFRIVQREGKREVAREIDFYNLDATISVGYRVNSAQATQFRIWATQTLREFIVKGFPLNSVDVKTKAAAATQWCQYATEHEGKNGGKPWTYLLIPHDAISENKTLKGLAATYTYRDASNG